MANQSRRHRPSTQTPASSREAPAPAPSNQDLLRIMRSAAGRPDTPVLDSVAAGATAGGEALDDDVREAMEAAFGHSFAHVRIHADGDADDDADALGANAWTVGSHIHFLAGNYAPGTPRGDRLLAHELTHVVQHDEGRLAAGDGVSHPAESAEGEASANEGRILQRIGQQERDPTSVESPPPVRRATSGGGAAPILRDPQRDDEDWSHQGPELAPEERYTLHGSTRRFAALMHIYQSGDFGDGGLGPDTVVAPGGITLEQLYGMYREGRISGSNGALDLAGASSLVERIRRHGWVDTEERATELGLPMGEGGFDGPSYGPLHLEEPGVRPLDQDIDAALSGDGGGDDHGLRSFIQGGAEGTGRERRARSIARDELSIRLRPYQEQASGLWVRRDGRPMTDAEEEQLRRDLVARAETSGLLRGAALERYREHLADEHQPTISGTRFRTRERDEQAAADLFDSEIAPRRSPYEEPTSDEDLADARARSHVLASDATGGGHSGQGGLPGKSEFPDDWDEARILRAASDIVTDPASTAGESNSPNLYNSQGQPNRHTFEGERDGVRMRVVYEPATDRIVSAFPVGGDRNPRTAAAGGTPSAEDLDSRLDRRIRQVEDGDPEYPGRTEEQRGRAVRRLRELRRQLDQDDSPQARRRIARALQADREGAGPVRVLPAVAVEDAPAEPSPPGRQGEPRRSEPEEDDDPVRIPRTLLPGGGEEEAGPSGPLGIGNRSVSWRQERPAGGSRTAEVQASRNGGGAELQQEGPDGRQRSVRAEVQVQHRGDRVVGGDATVGAGAGRYHGSLTGGGTYWADPPHRSGDRFTVQWSLQVRAGGSLGGRLLSGGASVNVQGFVGRSGTHVFPIESDVDAARERATAFQREIESWDEDRLARELGLAADQDLGSYDWWTTEAPVGTARTVQIGGTIGGSISGQVVSAGGQVTTTDQGAVRKTGEQQFEVEVTYVVDRRVDLGGDFMVGNTGSFGLVDNARYERETQTYRVELPDGEQALRRHLAREAVMNAEMSGVTLLGSVTEEGDLQTNQTNLLVADIDDRRGVTRQVTTDAEGTEHVAHRAYVEGSGSAVNGDYFRDHIQFEAPEDSDGVYRFSRDLHSTEDEDSSGNWNIHESFTQEQMRMFHVRFLERHPGTGGVTIYDRTADALRRIPTTAAGDAARAPVIAELIAAEGDRGYQIVRSLAGGPSRSTTQLYAGESADAAFLSEAQRGALEARITGWEARGTAADLAEVDAERDRMRERRDAVADTSRYPDLPVDRDELVADYTRLLQRLDGVRTRLGRGSEDDAADRLDDEAYAVFWEARQARGSAQRTEARAEGAEAEAQEARSRLPSSTGGRFSGAASEMAAGRAALARGDALMPGNTESRPRLSPETDLRQAIDTFQEAERHFRAAQELYHGLIPGSAPAPSPEPAAPTEAPRGRRRAARTEVARRPAAQAPAEPRRIEPRQVVTAPEIAARAHLVREGLAYRAEVDTGSVELRSGIVVQLLSARIPPHSNELMDQLGDDRLCQVFIRIVTPAPGLEAFEVPVLSGGGATHEQVQNQPGRFDMLVRVRG